MQANMSIHRKPGALDYRCNALLAYGEHRQGLRSSRRFRKTLDSARSNLVKLNRPRTSGASAFIKFAA